MESCSDESLDKDSYMDQEETLEESENNATNEKGTENQENEGDRMESCSDESLDKGSYLDQEETLEESESNNDILFCKKGVDIGMEKSNSDSQSGDVKIGNGHIATGNECGVNKSAEAELESSNACIEPLNSESESNMSSDTISSIVVNEEGRQLPTELKNVIELMSGMCPIASWIRNRFI